MTNISYFFVSHFLSEIHIFRILPKQMPLFFSHHSSELAIAVGQRYVTKKSKAIIFVKLCHLQWIFRIESQLDSRLWQTLSKVYLMHCAKWFLGQLPCDLASSKYVLFTIEEIYFSDLRHVWIFNFFKISHLISQQQFAMYHKL